MTEFTLLQILTALLLAARWTVVLSICAFVSGGLVGLLVLVARTAGGRAVRIAAGLFIEVTQGTPLLMQLFLAFFGLGLLGFDVPASAAAGLALTLWTAAFLAEIWRGCLEAIPKGQWEAARALGLAYPTLFRHVILPQMLRLALPPTVGFSVQVVKGTALTSIIGFIELSKAGTMITNATFEPFKVYGLVALIYFALCWPLSKASRMLEIRLGKAPVG